MGESARSKPHARCNIQDTLNTAKLTNEERTKLEESLENVSKQLRTKDEQAKLEN
jgi:hypothetical protein